MDKNEIIDLMKNMKSIVGILSTSQPVKFGKTKSGKPIYQIKPIKKILPPFWITYGGKLQGRIIISFKFKEWNDDSKSPFGEIIKIIGLVEDSNLSETLLTHYEIDRKPFKSSNILENEYESKIIRRDMKHLDIFSIDPKGCIDIDDALSIQEVDNKIYIGVHIAQPICWLSKQEIIDRSHTAFSTLYMEKNKNLWSDEVTEKASLFVNMEKPAYSTIFTIEDNKISNIESFPSIIINKRNTWYEKINYPNIMRTKEITEKLVGKEIDSHELVSYWMIETNKYIGDKQKNIPFRSQNIDETKTKLEIEKIDPKIQNIFSNMLLEGASYSYDKYHHHSLNVSKYTHFTSPIRRIIDTIIHFNITYPGDEIILDLENINLLDYKTKKFHRQMNLIETIKNLPEEKETIGYIYSKNLDSSKWMVYFEEIGLIKVKIRDNKFDYLKDSIDFDKYKIGESYPFKIYKKVGFLPNEKLLIILSAMVN